MKVIYTRNEGTVWIPNWRYTYLRNNPIIHEYLFHEKSEYDPGWVREII